MIKGTPGLKGKKGSLGRTGEQGNFKVTQTGNFFLYLDRYQSQGNEDVKERGDLKDKEDFLETKVCNSDY